MITLVKIDYDGIRIYDIDGKIVKVWPGYLFCRECGRPLTDPHSQKKGYGPDCAPDNNRRDYTAMVLVVIGDDVFGKTANDKYHPIIKLVAPNTAYTGRGSSAPVMRGR